MTGNQHSESDRDTPLFGREFINDLKWVGIDPATISVGDICLSGIVRRALRELGIVTLDQLAEMTPAELRRRIPNLPPLAINGMRLQASDLYRSAVSRSGQPTSQSPSLQFSKTPRPLAETPPSSAKSDALSEYAATPPADPDPSTTTPSITDATVLRETTSTTFQARDYVARNTSTEITRVVFIDQGLIEQMQQSGLDPANVWLVDLGLTTRAQRRLASQRIYLLSDLVDMSETDVLAIRGAGHQTVEDLHDAILNLRGEIETLATTTRERAGTPMDPSEPALGSALVARMNEPGYSPTISDLRSLDLSRIQFSSLRGVGITTLAALVRQKNIDIIRSLRMIDFDLLRAIRRSGDMVLRTMVSVSASVDRSSTGSVIALGEGPMTIEIAIASLSKAIGRIGERKHRVLDARYSLTSGEPLTLAEAGTVMDGITRERVRQIEVNALDDLRAEIPFRKRLTQPFDAFRNAVGMTWRDERFADALAREFPSTALPMNSVLQLVVALYPDIDTLAPVGLSGFESTVVETLARYGPMTLDELTESVTLALNPDERARFPEFDAARRLRLFDGVITNDERCDLVDTVIPDVRDVHLRRINTLKRVLERRGPSHFTDVTVELNSLLPAEFHMSERDVHSWLSRYTDQFAWAGAGAFRLKTDGKPGEETSEGELPEAYRPARRTGIGDAIVRLLLDRGTKPLSEIEDDILARFRVQPTSVRASIVQDAAERFILEPNNMVRLRPLTERETAGLEQSVREEIEDHESVPDPVELTSAPTPRHFPASLDQLLAIKSVSNEGPQWAPDGRSLTFVSSLGGTPELWSADVTSGTLERLTVGLGGVGHLATFIPRWSPTGEYVAVVTAKSGVDEVWLWPSDGGELFQLSKLGGRIEALSWAPDGSWLTVASNAFGQFDIFRISVPDGQLSRLTDDSRYDVYPTVTPDGNQIHYVRLNDDWTDHEVIRINSDGSQPEVMLTDTDFFDYHYGRTFGYPTIGPDGGSFLFRSHRSSWINIWQSLTFNDGPPRQIAPADADQGDAVWSPDGRHISFVENHNGTLDLRVVAVSGGEPRILVAPDSGVITEPAWSPDGSHIAYLLGGPLTPNDLWIVDVASGEQRQLTRSMLGGQVRERLVAPEKVNYQTWDGRQISAYLYRPPNRKPDERFPGLLWIHGGPTAQFMDTRQPQVQYFLAQGYVVLLPNVRGSSGYGREFEDLNNRDWGHGDLRDAIAGVDFLKTLDDVDAENFGITGTSYGGIMAMAAVAWAPPGTFKAAIPCSGYGDFLHMANEQELRHIKLMDYEFGKLPEAEVVYRRSSPIFDLARATAPCFLVHGEGRYPGSTASRDFALALEWNYKPFWYKAYPGETYYVAGTENVRRMLLDMLAFLDFYLKGVPHTLPDDGKRPMTRMSGLIPEQTRTGSIRFSTSSSGTPPRDMAN